MRIIVFLYCIFQITLVNYLKLSYVLDKNVFKNLLKKLHIEIESEYFHKYIGFFSYIKLSFTENFLLQLLKYNSRIVYKKKKKFKFLKVFCAGFYFCNKLK